MAGDPALLLQLAPLFDCLEDVLAWIKDREGRYRWVNRAFLISHAQADRERPTGPDAPCVIGKTDYDLSPAYLADQFRLDDEQVLAGKRIVNRIEQVGQPGGQAVWNVTNKVPILDAEGHVIGTAGITRPLDRRDGDDRPASEFSPILAYVRDHYHEPITNQQLARLAHMSVRAFERKFLASFHLTPQRYLRKLQLRMASRALVYTTKSLADVALSCGFADQSHFTREFRRQFGRTPGEYRRYYVQGCGDVAPVIDSDAGGQ
jgi:AraC-like DNA-binding protein